MAKLGEIQWRGASTVRWSGDVRDAVLLDSYTWRGEGVIVPMRRRGRWLEDRDVLVNVCALVEEQMRGMFWAHRGVLELALSLGAFAVMVPTVWVFDYPLNWNPSTSSDEMKNGFLLFMHRRERHRFMAMVRLLGSP